MFPSLHRQQGSMLVIAIFVMVVMLLLGLALVRVLSASSDALVYEVYGLRAFNAAQSGLERHIAQVFVLDGSEADGALEAACSGPLPALDLGGIGGLENCTVVSRCDLSTPGSANIDYYRFSSTGTCSAGEITASRTVAVDARVEN